MGGISPLAHRCPDTPYPPQGFADPPSAAGANGTATNGTGAAYYATGLVPDNTATVLRQHYGCGAFLLVLDALLLPVLPAAVASLPQLVLDSPIPDSLWLEVDTYWDRPAGNATTPAPGPDPAAAGGGVVCTSMIAGTDGCGGGGPEITPTVISNAGQANKPGVVGTSAAPGAPRGRGGAMLLAGAAAAALLLSALL